MLEVVRFLVDTQLPKGISLWLSQRGHQAEHVLAVGLAQSKGTPVWRYAEKNGAVIITKDEDFAEWVSRGWVGPAVVWLRIGNSSKGALLTWLEPLLPMIVRQLERGDRLVEVR